MRNFHNSIKNIIRTTILSFLGLSSIVIAAPGAGINNDFGGRRVLFIGIDGCRPDSLIAANTPNIDALMAKGVITYNAVAGGELGGASQQATSSGPGWSSLLTGVWVNKHLVSSNNFSGNDFASYPHYFRRIKEEKPGAYVSSIINWGPIDTAIVADSIVGGVDFMNFRKNVASDILVGSEAATHLGNANPDALFLHFDDVDHAGHASGYSKDVPAYISSIEGVDTQIGVVVAALQARPQYAQEDWLIIVTTDHGGINTSHGGQSVDERTIFMLVSGGATEDGVVSTESPGQPAVPATTLRHLGISVKPAWGWEEPSFGLPAPSFTVQGAAKHALLSWTIPAAGVSGLTGFELRRNGVTIANLGVNARSYTDSPSPLISEALFKYDIIFTGSTERPLNNSITLGGSLDVTSDLEMHLSFDNSSTDSTSNGHHANAVGGAQYVPGRINQAAVVDSTRHFTVPQIGGLQFGANTDFTIGFWMKSTGQWTGDPSFISNKNWSSGNNNGWVIAAESSGARWQWNLKGLNADRRDFDAGGTVQDGKWHHILVSHDRTGVASFYQDGKLLSTTTISGDGDVNTTLPLVIGSDGGEGFNFSAAVHMDEVKVWTRKLTQLDIQVEANSDSAYQIWREGHFSSSQLNQPLVSGDDADPDNDGMTNLMEFAINGDPLVAGYPTPLTVTTTVNNYILSWPQRNAGFGEIGVNYRVDGITYAVEFSHDFVNWSKGSSAIVEQSAPTHLSSGWHTAHATLVNPPLDPNKPIFFRLKVVR